MDALTHAHLAQILIAACDGVDAIVRQKSCRIGSTQLYAAMDHGSGYFLPADVICCLEQYCGEPHYSRALFEFRPAAPDIADVATEACELTEAAALLQAKAREAMRHPQGVTPRIKRELHGLALTAMEEAREIAAATELGAEDDAAPAPGSKPYGLALTAMEEAREIAAATELGAEDDAAPAPGSKPSHLRAAS